MACVSDSYDIFNACEKVWGEELKDVIIERGKNGGVLVVRPDSGDPPAIVVQVRFICWKNITCDATVYFVCVKLM